MTDATPLFSSHERLWEANRYVYPVISRRSRGLSIGVNLNPDGRCNFDCVYCSVDRKTPRELKHVDLEVLGRELSALLALSKSGALYERGPFAQTPSALRRLNDVALSGDGEPTSSPLFEGACRLIVELLEEQGLAETKVVVITNATLLERPKVRQALDFLSGHGGEIWAKLDAGTDEWFRKVDRGQFSLARIVENLKLAAGRWPLVIQSMFLRVDGVAPSEAEVAAWLGHIGAIKAAAKGQCRVQVYTVARRTAESFATPLEKEHLEQIAARARALGVEAEVFGAAG